MKNFKSYIAIIIVVMIFCATTVNAQFVDKNNVPANVTAAITAKYPKADVKSWQLTNGAYTAKVKEGGNKYFVTFDKNGAWVYTVSKHNWPGALSPVVKKAFNKSNYGAWHIYGVNIVDSPKGQIYQVMIDDSNHRVNARHNEIFTDNRMVEFKSTGEFVGEKDVVDTAML